MAPAPHDDVAPFAFLLGTWRGEGTGSYPTIEDFAYREEMLFEHVGDPFLLYRQESWDLTSGAPVHFERGFLRPGKHEGDLELCLAHPIGVTEIAHGRVEGQHLSLTARGSDIARAATGLDVRELERRYRIDGDVMTYQLDMATGDTPLSPHLEATLRRQA